MSGARATALCDLSSAWPSEVKHLPYISNCISTLRRFLYIVPLKILLSTFGVSILEYAPSREVLAYPSYRFHGKMDWAPHNWCYITIRVHLTRVAICSYTETIANVLVSQPYFKTIQCDFDHSSDSARLIVNRFIFTHRPQFSLWDILFGVVQIKL